jgi:uncharacterized protein
MSQNRNIGRVLSVDNFRVYIKIDDDLHGAYKSGVHDIYEIARINSYLILPVGVDRVVALITRVSMREEFDLDKNASSIKLPTSARYISATMLGTITKEGDNEKFIQGVYSFPTLDNPVWYVAEKDLKHIFDDKQDITKIEYDKDFYLPIGTSPAFPDYKVKICPDQFFVKHAAILGNTGSGKSCTFTSIIKNLFNFDYKGKKLENAHFIVFDTNGEYKDAFFPTEKNKQSLGLNDKNRIELINAYYYGGDENVKVPYWYMNWDDFNYLLKPSEGSQAPVLNRAIGLAKNYPTQTLQKNSKLEIIELEHFETISEIAKTGDWWKAESLKNSYDAFKMKLPLKLQQLNLAYKAPCPTPSQIQEIDDFINDKRGRNEAEQIINEQNIDMPIWFNYMELCTKFIDAAIEQEGRTNNRINEYLSTLRLRMNSFLNDKRMAIPLMLKITEEDDRNILSQFMAFILGDFNRYFKDKNTNSFIAKYNEKNKPHSSEKTSQITIVDTSQLPFEVLETVTALLGRLIIEFVSNFKPEERGNYPIVIVLEEAQNYISEKRDSIAKTVFERIAREGRKYGISLVVCSQRPSELSKTVLSQCNSFIIHRLQNPEDQIYIRGLISSANADILDQLPIIPQQHAIITGDCVRTPIQVKIDNVNPTPNSHNPKYIERWLDKDFKIPYEETCKQWCPNRMDD